MLYHVSHIVPRTLHMKLHLILITFYAAAAKVTSVVSDSVRPQRQQPTRVRHPWDSPGKKEHLSGLPFPSPMHESEKGK